MGTAIFQPAFFRQIKFPFSKSSNASHPTTLSTWRTNLDDRLIASRRFTTALVILLWLVNSSQLLAIERITLSIGELHGQQGVIKNLSSEALFKPNRKLDIRLHSSQVELKHPFSHLQSITLHCPAFSLKQYATHCQNGTLTIDGNILKQLTIPFNLNLSRNQSGNALEIPAVPFAAPDSQLSYNWNTTYKTINSKIDALSLKAFAGYLQKLGLSVSSGTASLNGGVIMRADQHQLSDFTLAGKQLSLQTEDATKAIEKLNLQSIIQAATENGVTRGNAEIRMNGGELYLEPLYLSLQDDVLSAQSRFVLDQQQRTLTLNDLSVYHFPTVAITGSLATSLDQAYPPKHAHINVQIYHLANLFNQFIAPFLKTSSTKPVVSDTQGLIQSHIEFADSQPVNLSLSTADLSATYTFNQKNFRIDHANIALNWKPDHCTDNSFVHWESAQFSKIPLPRTVLRFMACGKQINFERHVTLPLLDGEMQFEHLDLKQLEDGSIDFSFATEIRNISLVALSEALDLPPLDGYLSASIPSVRLEQGGLRLDSSILIHAFGGKVEIQHLQIDGMLGSYPILTADIHVEKLDLGKLSKRFAFGNIEGKLNGSIKGLRIENQKLIAFDAEFSTPENRILPYSISQKAVENIASLGGNNPADLLSRGVLKLFESFFYSRLGFSCKLRNNVCQLNGIASAQNKGFYLVKGSLAPQINIIGFNRQVNWSELANRLKRITSQSAPVIQ